MRETDSDITSGKRPWGIRWLTLGLLVTSLVHLAAAFGTLRYTAIYSNLGVSVPIPVLFVRGLAWGALFLLGTVRLWQLRNGAPHLVLLLVGAFSLFQFAWWAAFVRSDYGQTRFPFAVFLTIVALGLVAWYLNRPHVQALFTGKASDPGPTNSQRQGS